MQKSNNGWVDSAEDEKDFDWGNVSTEAPPPLEPGVYFAKVTKAEAKKAQQSDSKLIEFELQVSHKFGDAEGTASRRIRFNNLVAHKDSLWKAKQFCLAAGIECFPNAKAETLRDFALDIVGRGLWCEVGSETSTKTGKAQTFNNVRRFLTEEEAQKQSGAGSGADAAVAGSDEVAGARRRRRAS